MNVHTAIPVSPSVADAGSEALARFSRDMLPGLEAALRDAVQTPEGLSPFVTAALESSLGVGGRGTPGSRWRPLLTLATARAAGIEASAALPAAVAVELTHTASLVLDDLPCMDDAAERRGQAPTHQSIGTGGAILVAMALLAKAAELLGQTPGQGGALVASWGRAFGLDGMAGGQVVDLAGSFQAGGAARRLHRRKTTALSAFATEAGARAANCPEPCVQRLTCFGRDLGWAYQLADDAADSAEDGRIGRAPGGRAPRDQSRRVLRQALRHLHSVSGLDTEGRALLEALAQRAALFPQAEEMRNWDMSPVPLER
jgi:geranylgeranyl diphosphate synthase, type II